MFNMFNITKLWESRFDFFLYISILFIVGMAGFNLLTNKKGTWYQYYVSEYDKNKNQYKKVATESKGETECRNILQDIFKKPFNKIRPDWLKNHITGGNNLEIDCYNDDLKLGIEYQGRQHYEFCPYFHKTKDSFYNQKYRDDDKRRKCTDHGITLIEVPYNVKDIRGFLITELLNAGYIRNE